MKRIILPNRADENQIFSTSIDYKKSLFILVRDKKDKPLGFILGADKYPAIYDLDVKRLSKVYRSVKELINNETSYYNFDLIE